MIDYKAKWERKRKKKKGRGMKQSEERSEVKRREEPEI